MKAIREFARSLNDPAGRHRIPELAAFVLILATAAVAPLSYGSILPAGGFRLELLALAAGVCAFLSNPHRFPSSLRVPAASVGLIAILGLIQLIPLPTPALKVLSPAALKIYHEVGGVLGAFARRAPPARISLAAGSTADALLQVVALISLALAAGTILENRARRQVMTAVILGGAALNVAISVATLTGSDRLHGTYVNADHFAAYLEISLGLAFGLLWAELARSRSRAHGIRDPSKRLETRLPPLALRVLLWGFFAAAIVLTRSRGGFLAALLATGGVSATAIYLRRGRTRGLAIWISLAAGIAFVIGATQREALVRFLAADPRDIGADLRFEIWKTTLRAARAFAPAGSGLGCFREAFRRFQPRSLAGLVEQAHSDWFQMLVTGGIPAFALCLLAAWRLAAHWCERIAEHGRRAETGLAVGALAGFVALAIHGLVDSNFAVPATPATFAIVVGMAAAAAAAPSSSSSTHPSFPTSQSKENKVH